MAAVAARNLGRRLRVLAARGVRAFGDGFVALLLPIYLVELRFSPLAVGAIVTSTLIGTALLTLWVGWIAVECGHGYRGLAEKSRSRAVRGALSRE